jgi:hypothetical protein
VKEGKKGREGGRGKARKTSKKSKNQKRRARPPYKTQTQNKTHLWSQKRSNRGRQRVDGRQSDAQATRAADHALAHRHRAPFDRRERILE